MIYSHIYPTTYEVSVKLYYLIMNLYIYRMIIMINPDNNWYGVIWYMYKKNIYSHIYPSTYGVHVQMLSPKHVLLHIRDDNYDMILLSYVSTLYATYVI